MDQMDRELLTYDMVTGYHTYVEPAELSFTATAEAPAIPATPSPETPNIIRAAGAETPKTPQMNHWIFSNFGTSFGGNAIVANATKPRK